MRGKRCPIIRYGWRDALDHVREGGSVHIMRDGHAECLGGKTGSECLGYMTKRSVSAFIAAGGKVGRGQR